MHKDRLADVEKELYNLRMYKKILAQRQYDLLDKGPKEKSKSKEINDPTAYEVIRKDRIEKEIELYEGRVKALEMALTSLTKMESEVIAMKYLNKDGYNNAETMNLLGLNKNKYYELKWSALEKLKEVLGDEYFSKLPNSGKK